MFATKAVRIWQETPEEDRPALVRRYLALAGGFAPPAVEFHRPPRSWLGDGDPLWTVVARRAGEVVENRESGRLLLLSPAPGRFPIEEAVGDAVAFAALHELVDDFGCSIVGQPWRLRQEQDSSVPGLR